MAALDWLDKLISSCELFHCVYSTFLFADDLILPKIIADSQLPLTEVLASIPDIPPLSLSSAKVDAESRLLSATPVSPVVSNRPFVLPLKHPLPPSLTPHSPLASIEFDPSNVVVEPPLPSSYEVLHTASSPAKIPKEVRYSSLSPRVLVRASSSSDSPFRSSVGGVWMSALSNYDDEVDAISRTGRAEKDHVIRKLFLLHPNQYHLVPSEALSKVPELDLRKVYLCPSLNHIVTCEEGEFENEEGVPAPEFDLSSILKAGTLRMLSYLTFRVVQIFKRYKLQPLFSLLCLVGFKVHHLFVGAIAPRPPKLHHLFWQKKTLPLDCLVPQLVCENLFLFYFTFCYYPIHLPLCFSRSYQSFGCNRWAPKNGEGD